MTSLSTSTLNNSIIGSINNTGINNLSNSNLNNNNQNSNSNNNLNNTSGTNLSINSNSSSKTPLKEICIALPLAKPSLNESKPQLSIDSKMKAKTLFER